MSKDLAQQHNEVELQNVQWDLHEVEEQKSLEFTDEIKPDLFGLDLVKAQEMTIGLSATIAEREVLKNAYIEVIELEITPETLPTFKELRLKIVKNRTQGLDKWKEREKAFYLQGGRFVDAIYNKELRVNQEMESKLMEAEKFFENQEKEKAQTLNLERIEKIRPYIEDVTGLDFAPMTDEDFDDYLLGKKTRFENEKEEKIRLEKEAEEVRLAEIERQKEIELENAKLKAEAEAKELALQKERADALAKQKAIQDEADKKAVEEKARQEAILKAEQEEKAKLESELQGKKDAEIKAENERLAKEKAYKLEAEKLAKAPIKKQLSVWVDSFGIPNVNVDNEVSKEIKEKFEAFKKWSISKIDSL